MNKYTKWLPLLILGILMAAAYTFELHKFIGLEILQAQKDALRAFRNSHFLAATIGFLGAYVIIVALSLPVATLLTLLGGFLFGRWLGTLLAVTGATVGATVIFLIARSAAGQALRDKAGTVYRKIEDEMCHNAASYLLFMRLVPLFPFWLVNIVPALFNVPLRVFVLTTFLGIIPGSFVYVNVGQALGEIESLRDIISAELLLAFILLGLFALLPALYKKMKARG